ncbi:unnamed protein product [Caenorhabditis auriculariae]|uniref:Uncharacterized protein n=1 Tax=Caenorhabditis auriculariae TaxID=2777116 RepID=A0A8S1HWS1_9PELO|nr:unnamed protein product [Caenorhabditis auriculariae]
MDFDLEKNLIFSITNTAIMFICVKLFDPENCPKLFSIEMRNYTIVGFFYTVFLRSYLPYASNPKNLNPEKKTYAHLFPSHFSFYLTICLPYYAYNEENFHEKFFSISLTYWVPSIIIMCLTHFFHNGTF